MVVNGATYFLKECLFDQSDVYHVHVCEHCNFITIANLKKNNYECRGYKTKIDNV
jgi:DNA-directed RNA polymerase II subunit RPB2